MQSPQAKLKEIRRILTLWPTQATDDADDLIRGYLLAVEDYHAGDVEVAVDTLVKGTAPGINPSFRPKPSEVGAECRRQLNMRLESERRHQNFNRPVLAAPPPVVHTPEQRAKVKAMVEKAVDHLSSVTKEEDDATAQRRREMLLRATEAERARSGPAPLGFDVGDMDGDQDAA